MPELSDAAGYLVALLHSAGVASATGMGLNGLSWQEIEAWARCNDYVGILSPKEYRAVYTLSRAYVSEHAVASKKGAKAPYVKEEKVVRDVEVRAAVADKADDLFGSLIRAQNRTGPEGST